MTLAKSNKFEVRDSPIHGRGVFATQPIGPNETIEECHFLVLEKPTSDPLLHRMVFCWPMRNTSCHAVVFGCGSVFNHSEKNNATWETDTVQNVFRFITTRPISAGEEILINYMT